MQRHVSTPGTAWRIGVRRRRAHSRFVGQPERLMLYDGDCGLCQKSVQWLLDHDTEGKLRFAPLQGETAQPILEAHEELKDVDSVVYVEGDEAFVRSARSSS